MYKVTIKKSAAKAIAQLPKSINNRLIPKIKQLGEEPRPPGAKKLQGAEDLWRIRVGSYRVIYSIQDMIMIVDVIQVAHRKDIYRKK
jgi:mRNA interferase RelE/StbE